MYCSNCGKLLDDSYRFCPSCGAAVGGSSGSEASGSAEYSSGTGNALGTLVAVMLLGGAIRNLYYRNGLYYYDRFCHRPYPMGMIMGPCHPHHHGLFGGLFGGPGGFLGGPHGGPHGGGGMFGGPHGGPGGFGGGHGGFGGGPHGGGFGGGFGGGHGGPGGHH